MLEKLYLQSMLQKINLTNDATNYAIGNNSYKDLLSSIATPVTLLNA